MSSMKLLASLLNEQIEKDAAEDDAQFDPAYKDEADVAVHVFPYLQQRIEKLNKRARKLKLPEIKLEVLDKFMKNIRVEDPYDPYEKMVRQIEMYKVKVHGDTPKIAGYKFIATIEHQDGGNIIRTVPGQEGDENIKDFYESKPHYCDHCKKVRRRIDTFIVKEEKTGKLRQIGRNCLTDFLGGADPKAVLWYFNNLNDFFETIRGAEEEAVKKGARADEFLPLDKVLSTTAAIIRTYGYMSAKKAQEMEYGGPPTTSMRVKFVLFSSFAERGKLSDEDKRMLEVGRNPDPKDVKLVQEVLAWFKSLPEEQKRSNEFMHNLSVIVNSDKVNRRNVGYIVAIFPTYMRAMDLIKQKAAQPQKSNEWIGKVGEKIAPTKVKVIRTRMISGQFGTTQIVTMEDPKGNVFVWFNNSANNLDEGAEYTIVGTIKKHDEFNGRKQTHLIRVKAK